MLKVQEVILDNFQKRYILVNGDGSPVLPVMKYLKYLDSTGKSYNTQKTYCYALKHYFTYLLDMKRDYKNIRLEDLVHFVSWLQNPFESATIASMQPVKASKTAATINLTVTAVTNFYDYLYRTEAIETNVVNLINKQVFTGGKTKYKSFLYHVANKESSHHHILKVKAPKRVLQILSKDKIQMLLEATTNTRDRLLIHLLFETGLRIGEALSLFIEDFKLDHKHGHRIRLVDRGELKNGAKLKTGEREIYISQRLLDLYDDYLYEVLDDLHIDTNFLFVKLRGLNTGEPMNYQDVSALFKRLKKKTGIHVHPHLLRHTHATMYYKQTKDIKQVQERLGHAQIQTTMNFYLHLSDEEIRENWEKAQVAFDEVTKKGKR
ncbi:Site-specific recombinase XerD [Domibacillus enclensis]|uniref:Site-specific recombinase XerD n=1 Tax=Domibacillus enclensis TaxID=1017273 RepID=A0A1N6NI88_9BACI|nr:Site-specific recombinase XerD [Domibacillus enclensis]